MLLSPRAIEVDAEGVHAWVSLAALEQLESDGLKNSRPPKFALADHLATGVCPEEKDATWIEKQCVALSQLRGVLKYINGGHGKVLQSHLLSWLNQDTTVASELPPKPGELS
jgi:hypothetical protein